MFNILLNVAHGRLVMESCERLTNKNGVYFLSLMTSIRVVPPCTRYL